MKSIIEQGIIETKRFILRKINIEDLNGLFELDSNKLVHKYIGNKPNCSLDQTLESIHNFNKQYLENGIGRWAIIDKTNGDFIGWCGLKLIIENVNNHTNYHDLGYRIIPQYWNQGIATETSIAVLEYAFEIVNLKTIYAIADCDNIISNKLLANLGFKFIENFLFSNTLHHWYKITVEDFHFRKMKVHQS